MDKIVECRKCNSTLFEYFSYGRFDGSYCSNCFTPQSIYHECCSNQEKIFVRVEQGQGVVQRTACKNCKLIFGSSLKKDANFNTYPYVTKEQHQDLKSKDELNRKLFNEKYFELIENNKEYLQGINQQKSIEWWANYNKYLLTDKWKSIRKKILERDKNICQGCLTNKATEVHHLTYQNVTDELLFQLVSVCKPCHDKIHTENNQHEY